MSVRRHYVSRLSAPAFMNALIVEISQLLEAYRFHGDAEVPRFRGKVESRSRSTP